MLKPWQIKLLACPVCKSKLALKKKLLVCINCKRKYGFKSGFPVLIPDMSEEIRMSMEKWDKLYEHKIETEEYLLDLEDYQKNHQPKIVRQLDKIRAVKKGEIYLEIGCGPAYLGLHYREKGVLWVGVDYSIGALKIARKLANDHKIKDSLFICGDITHMPVANDSINLAYGGGTIEHFKDTKTVVSEIYRVLKKDGTSVNSVPCLNIGTIYRMRWGNIPNIPVFRQAFEFVNLKVLKGKHMTFGYELSFLRSTLKGLHKKAGFKRIHVDKLDSPLLLESVPNWTKPLFSYLCENSELFWPMYKVVAKK